MGRWWSGGERMVGGRWDWIEVRKYREVRAVGQAQWERAEGREGEISEETGKMTVTSGGEGGRATNTWS